MGEVLPIRVFWALPLADAARRRAASVAAALRERPGGGDVRWVREESLHVTLRFIGAIDPARIAHVVDEVRDATRGIAPLALRLADVHLFPTPRRPRVVALGVEPAAPLVALAAGVERGVVAAGFPAEPRSFRPHLTLGRARNDRRFRLEGIGGVTASVTAPGDAWDVMETVLFRSELTPDGARYTPLERVPLEPARAGARGNPLHP